MIMESPQADALGLKLIGYIHSAQLGRASLGLDVSTILLNSVQVPVYIKTQSSESAPKWSPTPPTKDGWYWVAESSFLTKPVWVLSGRAQEPDFWDDSFDVVSATETLGLLWYGPVQPPTPRSDSDN